MLRKNAFIDSRSNSGGKGGMLLEVGPCVATRIMCICWQMLLMRFLMLLLSDVKPINLTDI